MKLVMLLACASGCISDPVEPDPPIASACVEAELATGMHVEVPANTGSVCLRLDGSNGVLPRLGATTEMHEGGASGSLLVLTDTNGAELARGVDYLAGANPDRTSNRIAWYLDAPMRDVVLEIQGTHPALVVGLSEQND